MTRKVGWLTVGMTGLALGLVTSRDLLAQSTDPSGSPRSAVATQQRGAIYGSPNGSEATRDVAERIRRARMQRVSTPLGDASAAEGAGAAEGAAGQGVTGDGVVGEVPRVLESRLPGKPDPAGVQPLDARPAEAAEPQADDNYPLASPKLGSTSPPSMSLGDQPSTTTMAPAATNTFGAAPSASGYIPTPTQSATDSQPREGRLPAGVAPAAEDENLVLMSQGPLLRVETMGPRSVVLGKPARYRLVVVNEGDHDASDTMVRIVLPDWVEIAGGDATMGETQRQPDGSGGARVVWSVGRLSARARETLDLQLIPRQNQLIDMKVDWTFRPAVQTAQIVVKQPQLVLDIGGPSEILYGETATYTVTISNPGNGDAENVCLDVATAQGAAQSRSIGVIPAGGKEVVELELFARDAGSLAISSTVTGDAGLRAEAAKNVIVRRGQLQLQVRGSEYKYAGTQGEYLIRVSNIGDATANGVALAAVLPRGAEYVGGIDGGESANGRVDWRIASLSPGAQRDYLVRCNLPLPGTLRFQVHAVAEGDLNMTAECQTVVESVADLKLVINDPQGPLPVGKDVMYEIRVVNRGSKAAEEVKTVAQFSHGIEPVSFEGVEAEMVTGQVLFKPVRSLGPGETLVLKVFARAQEEGMHRFRTEVTCSDEETQLVFENTTKFFINKSFDASEAQRPAGSR